MNKSTITKNWLLILLNLFIYLFFSSCLFGKEYKLQWYIKSENTNKIIYDQLTVYGTTNAEGPWEDNLGRYGLIKCTGLYGSVNKKEEIDVNCVGRDNKQDKFSINMKRISEKDIGIGKATYLNGNGKYKHLIGIQCKYAVNYFEGTGFYKQVCTVPEKNFNFFVEK